MVSTIPPGAPRLLTAVVLGVMLVFGLAHVIGVIVPESVLFSTVLLVLVLGDIAVRAVTAASAIAGFVVMVFVNGWGMSVWTRIDDFSVAAPLAVAAVIAIGAALLGRLFRFTPVIPSQLEPVAAMLMALSWVGLGKGLLGGVIAIAFCVYDAATLFVLAAGVDEDGTDDEAWARATRMTDLVIELGWNCIIVAIRFS